MGCCEICCGSARGKRTIYFDRVFYSHIGAVDVPRGCDATPNDLEKILSITEAKYCVVENNAQVGKIIALKDKLPELKTIISIESEVKQENIDEAKAVGLDILLF